jgi:hypothetical protein
MEQLPPRCAAQDHPEGRVALEIPCLASGALFKSRGRKQVVRTSFLGQRQSTGNTLGSEARHEIQALTQKLPITAHHQAYAARASSSDLVLENAATT